MADQVTNYKCPACDGPMHFSGTTGRLECDYCGSSYSVEEIEASMEQKSEKAAAAMAAADAKAAAAKNDADWEFTQETWTEEGMKSYTCPSCAAELVCDDTTAATSCPYCGNPTVVPGQFSGMLKPEFVIPFKKEKADAIAALKEHYKGKPLLPKAFTAGNHIEEVKGVYVPFWLYDGVVSGEASYDGQKEHVKETAVEKIITTEHFDVRRSGSVAFTRVPADGSSKMPDDLMDSIEPYDYSDMTGFSKAYLAGFLADKYDVTAEENGDRIEERVSNTMKTYLRNTVKGYDSIESENAVTEIENGKITYAMMPVWLLSTRFKDKNYLFAMNGQTGKMVGDLPVDKGLYWRDWFITFAICFVIGLIINAIGGWEDGFLGFLGWNLAAPVGVSFLVGAILKGMMKSVFHATEAKDYITEADLKLTVKRDTFTHTTTRREPKNTD